MGDLASKRNARDLWISKGHVGAVVVLCLAMTIGAYALGYLAGKASGEDSLMVDDLDAAERGTVVELLDRIEGSTRLASPTAR